MRFCFLAATFALSVLCWTAPAAAQPYPDVVWNSMIDQVVHIELGNGLELTGTLIGHEGGQAVVAKANGSIVTLDTAEVAALRLVSGPSSGPPVAEQRPAPPSEDRGRAPDPVPPALSAGSETQLRLVASFEELYPPQSGLFEDIEEVEEWIVAAPLLGEEKNELERLLASYVENGRARIGLQLGGMGIALGGIAPVIYCAVQIGEEASDDPYTDGYEFFCGRRLVTVFSAPLYEDYDNVGVFLVVEPSGERGEEIKCGFRVFSGFNGALSGQRPRDGQRGAKRPMMLT